MANADTQRNKDTDQSVQEALNRSFDWDFHKLYVEPVDSDGTNALRQTSKLVAVKITTSGTDTYVGKAPIGTAQSAAAWQAKKIAVSGSDTTITWAGGTANFNQVATDLTALSYS